jgi:hypothetical protein
VSDEIHAKHEDVAIATVNPAPAAAIPFALTRTFLRNFIEGVLGFTLDVVQRIPIGTAYVKIGSFSDRDWLVDHSPHHFQGRTISLTNHNQGINHRAFTYNQECWLLLVAYPLDLWSVEASSYGAIVIKVRVATLEHIPHSCVVTDGNAFQGES